ncbi:LPP20 family lipoprotein [Arsukibacterium indicum]|uniref:LPP20 family lipoprotein n=1 Tax=Arsukibacterium indicum TaxID=2848612 RepID=A0ABS6MGI0_9GAMM|nr:LPP20 family lipoprotein [Arsukibacterium indicum]MBV2127904.1 LPP20 family lipoprotein [Arsukibacterium indicum]
MMKRVFITLSALFLCSCSQIFDKHIEYAAVKPDAFPLLSAVGMAPISLQPGESDSQKILLAMRASKLEAYRELAEQVYGQRIDSRNSVSSMVAGNDQFGTSVQGIIRGARVVKTYAIDDAYITELELDFEQVYHLYQNVYPRQKIKSIHYY